MKLLKLSLAAVMVMGTVSFAADNLADAFKNGSINGEIRAFYFDRSYGDGSTQTDADILNIALRMTYVTDSYNGFKLGSSIQSSHAPWADEDAKVNYSPVYDMYGSGTVLSEAYLSYTFNKTVIKVGRQYLDIPLMRSDASRIVLQAVEGVSVISKEIPNTTLYGAYVTKLQDRTSGTGDIPDFEKLPNNGDYGYVIGAENTSIQDLKLTLAYGKQDESHSMFLSQADYKHAAGDLSYVAGIQYLYNNYVDSAIDDAYFYGAKIGAGYAGFNMYVAYDKVVDGNTAFGIVMTDDKPMLYTSAALEAGLYNESEQYAVDINYMIPQIDLLIGARYVNVNYATNEDVDYKGLYAVYNFKGTFKGLSAVALYEQQDSNIEANDKDEFRLRLIYSF